MTAKRSRLREFPPALLARARGSVFLAAFVTLAVAALVPFVLGGSAAAKRTPWVQAKGDAAATAWGWQRDKRRGAQRQTRTSPGTTARRSPDRRTQRRRSTTPQRSTRPQAIAPAQGAQPEHKPAGANSAGGKPVVPADESKNQPARENTPGNPTPSPAGAGGGGSSSKPQLPRPARSSTRTPAASSAGSTAPQPTTPAGTVPTRALPLVGGRSQRVSRRSSPRRRSGARRGVAGETAGTARLGTTPLRRLASLDRPASPARQKANEPARPRESAGEDEGSPVAPVTRTVRDIVEVVPAPVQQLLLALALLSAVLAGGYLFAVARARRLDRQRGDLLQEVGLLQAALLPPVPSRLGAVQTSVAYRPSDGPAAGGDFYDALMLPGGRAAFILGDVSGHGRPALARTAFVRYTLRAYLEAGLDPRMALQVAGRVVDEHLGGDFATVLLAVHDPRTGSLTYASAGHPAPIVLGSTTCEPVLAASSPPIGLGMRTGLRQTTLPLPPGSLVCLYTDGLTEARTQGGILGRPRLGDMIEELGPDGTAAELLDAVAAEARLVSDDMAAVIFCPTAGITAGGFRTEQLEIDAAEVDEGLADRFLDACGADLPRIEAAVREVRRLCDQYGGAVLHVRFGIRGPRIEAVPRNVESLEAASRRALALAR